MSIGNSLIYYELKHHTRIKGAPNGAQAFFTYADSPQRLVVSKEPVRPYVYISAHRPGSFASSTSPPTMKTAVPPLSPSDTPSGVYAPFRKSPQRPARGFSLGPVNTI